MAGVILGGVQRSESEIRSYKIQKSGFVEEDNDGGMARHPRRSFSPGSITKVNEISGCSY